MLNLPLLGPTSPSTLLWIIFAIVAWVIVMLMAGDDQDGDDWNRK